MATLLPVLVCLPTLLAAAVVEDFAGAPVLTVQKGAERGTSAAVEAAPGGSDPALVVRLAERHDRLHEVNLAAGPQQSGPATVTLRARRSGSAQIWGVALRVLDARGETFQFITKTVPGAEWTTLSFAVDPAKHDGSWGGPAGGRMDATWRVLGLAVMGNDKPGAGELWFDDIACAAPTP